MTSLLLLALKLMLWCHQPANLFHTLDKDFSKYSDYKIKLKLKYFFCQTMSYEHKNMPQSTKWMESFKFLYLPFLRGKHVYFK